MTAAAFQRQSFAGAALAGLVGVAALFWWLCTRSNEVAFLPRSPGAEWIVPPSPASPDIHHDVAMVATFRCAFQLSELPATAALTVRAFRAGTVRINGAEVTGLALDGRAWKQVQRTDVASLLRAGNNEIEVPITNRLGPPALWLRLDSAQGSFGSDASWEVTATNAIWQGVRLAAQPMPIEPGSYLHGQDPLPVLLRQAWLPVLGFAVAVTLGIVWRRWSRAARWGVQASLVRPAGRHVSSGMAAPPAPTTRNRLTGGAAPVLLLVCLTWLVLFFNNLPQMPRLFGFDAEGHEEYIRYIQQNGALPLADEGWQMYQPPLYYVAAAAALELGGLTTADDASVTLLRVLSGVVGLAHCALVFLCLQLVFPSQRWKQAVGTLFAGFLPAHLCLSHYVTNETLSAAFVTAATYFCLRLLHPRSGEGVVQNPKFEIRNALLAGLTLGLALLTKFSAVLALPVMTVALAWPLVGQRVRQPRPWLCRLGVFLAATLAVCGWHYGRVWLHFGKPLVGNWDIVSGFAWWQLPGYRTADYYARFGEVFTRPLFSSFTSFGDGIYGTLWGDGLASSAAWMAFRPPWNYPFMGMAWVLAVVATGLICIGFFSGLARAFRQADTRWMLFGGCLAIFACGMVYMSLRVPSYAQVKAFYGLPALLPLTVALLAGWDWLGERMRWLHPVLWVWFITWALTVVVAFWVRPGNPETHVVKAIWAMDRGRVGEAAQHYERALNLDARNWAVTAGLAEAVRVRAQEPVLRGLYANALQRQDRIPEALHEYREALRFQPDSPALLNNLAWLLATHPETRFRDGSEAVRLAEKACMLTGRGEPVLLGTLAAAYAETDRFSEAVTIASQARELASKSGDTKLAKKNADLMEVYRAGKPWREAP